LLLSPLKRLLYVTPVAIGVSIVCFLLIHITPGDPLSAILPSDAPLELQMQMRAAYGFDKPLWMQYALWFWKVLHGDLGTSIPTGRPGAAAACPFFGFVAGYFRDSWLDKLASALSVLGVSVPHYWLGMVMVIIFSAQLGWLPPPRAGAGGPGKWAARPTHLRHH